MEWLNEPASWQRTGDVLTVSVDPGTDFWYQTGYGYIRDSGHVYGEVLVGDLDVSVRIRGVLEAQYDQAGIMLRADERTWLKTGVEVFEGRPRLSTVLTLGRSSWMVTDLPNGADDILLRLARRGDAVEVRYLVGDGQAELAALVFMPPDREVLAGVMCAAPEGPGFRVSFHDLQITERDWSAPAEDEQTWPDEAGAEWAGDEGGSSWAAGDRAPSDDDPGWRGDPAGEDDPGWPAGVGTEDHPSWPAGMAEDHPSWPGGMAREDHPSWPAGVGTEDHPSWPAGMAEDHPSWPGGMAREDHPSSPGGMAREDHPSSPGAAAGPPAEDRPAEQDDDPEPARDPALADGDRQVSAPAPTPSDWRRPADHEAVADWDRLAAGAQAGAQAERWTAQTDADVANEWPGPPLSAARRAAIRNGSTAAEESSSPAEPEPPAARADGEPTADREPAADGELPADGGPPADGEPPADVTDPEPAPAAPQEPAHAKGRKGAAARPPLDLPSPPDPADEWISLLTADPPDE